MKYLNYINRTWGDCLVQYNSTLHCKPARHHIFLGVGHCNSISVWGMTALHLVLGWHQRSKPAWRCKNTQRPRLETWCDVSSSVWAVGVCTGSQSGQSDSRVSDLALQTSHSTEKFGIKMSSWQFTWHSASISSCRSESSSSQKARRIS